MAHTAQKLMRKSVLLLILAALLQACGLKGPLYLPENKPAAAPPPAAAAADVPADTKKNPDSK